MDYIFNSAFICEALLKIISLGFVFDEKSYLRDTWNQLDFFIVLISILYMSIEGFDLPVLKILRMMRTLRPLRFVSHNVNIKIIVNALLHSMGAIANVLIVLFLIWLMFGILGVSLL